MAEYTFLDVVALAEQHVGQPVHAAAILRPTPPSYGGFFGLLVTAFLTFKRHTGWFPERGLLVVDAKT